MTETGASDNAAESERANKNESRTKDAKAKNGRGFAFVNANFGLKPPLRLSHTNLPTSMQSPSVQYEIKQV